jgi:hypothetical protein
MLLTALVACAPSPDAYERKVESARSCDPGDTCVLAGQGTHCACPRPVNARHADRINAMARELRCHFEVGCLPRCNPRCEDGRCVADIECDEARTKNP